MGTEYNWIIGLGALVLTLMTMQAGFGAWITSQFNKMHSSIDKIEDKIINKVEYHEQHDDRRFSQLGDSMWEIRLRLAGMEWPGDRRKDNFLQSATSAGNSPNLP